MALEAGEDIQLISQTQTSVSANGAQTVLSGIAQLQAGSLQVKAGGNLMLKAAQLRVQDKAYLQAGERMTLDGGRSRPSLTR